MPVKPRAGLLPLGNQKAEVAAHGQRTGHGVARCVPPIWQDQSWNWHSLMSRTLRKS